MGRIEAHYRKFPDHRRERPLITSEIQQSYSTIKALSDTVKPNGEEGGEVNKSVLSPTPGTQASETSGEPSLPMETLTTRPLEADTSPHIKNEPSSEVPEFIPMPEIVPVKPARGRGRGRRGRRGRGRGGRFGALGKPPSSSTKPPPAPPPSAISMLEKVTVTAIIVLVVVGVMAMLLILLLLKLIVELINFSASLMLMHIILIVFIIYTG